MIYRLTVLIFMILFMSGCIVTAQKHTKALDDIARLSAEKDAQGKKQASISAGLNRADREIARLTEEKKALEKEIEEYSDEQSRLKAKIEEVSGNEEELRLIQFQLSEIRLRAEALLEAINKITH